MRMSNNKDRLIEQRNTTAAATAPPPTSHPSPSDTRGNERLSILRVTKQGFPLLLLFYFFPTRRQPHPLHFPTLVRQKPLDKTTTFSFSFQSFPTTNQFPLPPPPPPLPPDNKASIEEGRESHHLTSPPSLASPFHRRVPSSDHRIQPLQSQANSMGATARDTGQATPHW